MKPSLAALAVFLASFGIAWWVKPAAASASTAATAPPRTRAGRPVRPSTVKPSTEVFFQRMKEAGYDEDEHRAVLDQVALAEIPELLAALQSRTGMQGLDIGDQDLVEELVNAWHAKAPADAQAWVEALKNDRDRNLLLKNIATLMAATDLDAALSLLHQHSTDENNLVSETSELMKIAVSKGENKLLEYCQLTLTHDINTSSCGLSGTSVISLSYPAEFDFQRVLNDLFEAKAAFGEGKDFGVLPSNLLSEWAKRDSRAAWAWLQEGKKLACARTNDFIEGYATVATPDEVGSFLASAFDPASTESEKYEVTWDVLCREIPSPVVLDRFLQSVPGDRTTHLNGLFDRSSGYAGPYGEKASAMILERMDPATRVAALQRKFSKIGTNETERNALTPVLRGLGHSEEEIKLLLPPSKE